MSVSKDHAAPRAMLIWVVGVATLSPGDVLATVTAQDHVWVMVLQKPGTGVVFVASITTKGSTDASIWSAISDHVGIRSYTDLSDLCCHQGCGSIRA